MRGAMTAGTPTPNRCSTYPQACRGEPCSAPRVICSNKHLDTEIQCRPLAVATSPRRATRDPHAEMQWTEAASNRQQKRLMLLCQPRERDRVPEAGLAQ